MDITHGLLMLARVVPLHLPPTVLEPQTGLMSINVFMDRPLRWWINTKEGNNMADTKTVLFSKCNNKHESTVYAISLAAVRLFLGADRYRSTAPGLGTMWVHEWVER